MRITHIIATTFVLAASIATTATAADKTAAVQEEITKIEHEMADACLKADANVFDRYIAPDWNWTLPDGTVQTKTDNLECWKKGAIKVSAIKLDEVKVSVHGNTAIAFVLDTETTNFKGKDVSGQYRTTDVFVKSEGKWMLVASHACKVEK